MFLEKFIKILDAPNKLIFSLFFIILMTFSDKGPFSSEISPWAYLANKIFSSEISPWAYARIKFFFVLLNDIENSFLVGIKICKKIIRQNLISNRLVIILRPLLFYFLFYLGKMQIKITFLHLPRKIKNQ